MSVFEWDPEKELLNIEKHGVDFYTACHVFLDPNRKIFVDSRHEKNEERFFCIGEVKDRVVTVRFVYRDSKIRIFGAGYWRKGSIMKKKIRDRNMPIGKLRRVDDFLPPPEELVMSEETVKVTISLSRSCIEFFKKKARQHRTKYQRMIRGLLDHYVSHYLAA